jgi:hypothetical protein
MFPFDGPPPAIIRLLQPSQQRHQDHRESNTIGLLGKIFTPGVPIDRPEEFSGRQELLKSIREKFSTKGQTLVIYGHRGLGKTSLTLVAFHKQPIVRHTCRKASTFQSIFLNILSKLNEQFSTVERSSKQSDGLEVGLREFGKFGSKNENSEKESAVAKQTLDPNFVVGKLGPWQSELKAIVIDEFQEVSDPEDQQAVIDTAKILSDHSVQIPIVLIGHAASDTDLFKIPAYHEYKGRYISAIEVKEMPDSELTDIIVRRENIHGTRFTPEALQAIVRIAAGYPTVVHRLALSASVDRASQQTALEVGWKAVLGGFGHVGTFLDDPAWLVTQVNINSAASKFVQEERGAHQGALIELIEFFSPSVPLPLDAGRAHAPTHSIPVPVLRGAGYVAKFRLETSADPKPFFLVFPEMDAGEEAAILQQWASHFYEDDLNLAMEKTRLPRVLGSVSVHTGWAYKTALTPPVYFKNVKLSGEDPEAEKSYWSQESFLEKFLKSKKDNKEKKPPE